MAAPTVATANIGKVTYNVYDNADYYNANGSVKTASKHVDDGLKKASIMFRFLQVLDKVPRAVNDVLKAVGLQQSAFLKAFGGMARTGWVMLGFGRLKDVTQNAAASLRGLSKERTNIPGEQARRVADAVAETCEAGAMIGYCGSTVAGCAGSSLAGPLLAGADLLDVTQNLSTGFKAAVDLGRARAAVAGANAQGGVDVRVLKALDNTATDKAFQVAKVVCSVAVPMISFALAIAFGASFVAPAALTAILSIASLAGTLFAISSYSVGQASPFEAMNFFNGRHVQYPAAV